MFRFTIRELMLVTALVATIAGWLWWRAVWLQIEADNRKPADWKTPYHNPVVEAMVEEWLNNPEFGDYGPATVPTRPSDSN